ncbi:MAG: hypothetical protein AAFP68_08650 [Pseudomonadota bacterium]
MYGYTLSDGVCVGLDHSRNIDELIGNETPYDLREVVEATGISAAALADLLPEDIEMVLVEAGLGLDVIDSEALLVEAMQAVRDDEKMQAVRDGEAVRHGEEMQTARESEEMMRHAA